MNMEISSTDRMARRATSLVSTITAECVVFSWPKVAAVISKNRKWSQMSLKLLFLFLPGLTVYASVSEMGPLAGTGKSMPQICTLAI